MIVIQNGKTFTEHRYKTEAEYEADIVAFHSALFGTETITLTQRRRLAPPRWGRRSRTGSFSTCATPITASSIS